MNEREVLIYLNGYLKGINYDPTHIGRANLIELSSLIVDALNGEKNEN